MLSFSNEIKIFDATQRSMLLSGVSLAASQKRRKRFTTPEPKAID